jgi:hypothetical protein
MVNPFQQQQRVRKFIYAGLILALFTVSLMHRRLMLEPLATELQLREVSRGEVELTSSAVRLSLTGSRGLAVTLLWSAAIKKQEYHEWNEVELLVSSITKLQPYFITPWLFQSWNLAFNVAVECDQPRDKYYYVSKGIHLLAEGERRNFKKDLSPGNPDMRYHLGFTYQLKIGTSDERNAMKCLLDMSCIDPARRDPERLWTAGERGKVINPGEFGKFCDRNPRLVRRLRDYLRCNTPEKVVRYLSENREIPSRFQEPANIAPTATEPVPTPTRQAEKQFPVLPPKLGDAPDPDDPDYTMRDEAFSVFLVARTWFAYAQEPLPPEHRDPGVSDPQFDRLKNRLPKRMSIYIFRGYPARAQVYMAESLQEEGWFDSEGWTIKDWFRTDLQVGTHPRYHSRPAWEKAYRMYMDYGIKNGLYLRPEEQARFDKDARRYRARFQKLSASERMNLPAHDRTPEALAHQKLAWNDHYRRMTNFDAHIEQADAERTYECNTARKLLFQAEHLRRNEQAFEQAVAVYEEAWPLWVDVLLQHPGMKRFAPVLEDIYEVELRYLRLVQGQRAEVLKPLCMGLAQFSVWPHLPLDSVMISDRDGSRPLVSANDQLRIIPIRSVRGPLESVVAYEGPLPGHEQRELLVGELNRQRQANDLKACLLVVTQAASPSPVLIFFPGQHQRLLASAAWRDAPVAPTFAPLLSEQVLMTVRDRVGLSRAPEQPASSEQPAPSAK